MDCRLLDYGFSTAGIGWDAEEGCVAALSVDSRLGSRDRVAWCALRESFGRRSVSCVARRAVATGLSGYPRRVFLKRDKAQSIVCVYKGIISYLSVEFSFFQDAGALGTGLVVLAGLQCFALPFALRDCKNHVWFCVSVT